MSYRWYQSGNSSDFIEGSTISVDLEPGTYLYYLEVCDAYNGYPKNEFIPIPGSNFGTWNETTYDGCALDSVTVTILDEQPPSKPVLDQDHALWSSVEPLGLPENAGCHRETVVRSTLLCLGRLIGMCLRAGVKHGRRLDVGDPDLHVRRRLRTMRWRSGG